VEGVIALIQKFCDPHGFDYHHVTQAFEDVGIPTLFLEIDNIVSIGQTKTRVEAFIEMLQPVEVEGGLFREPQNPASFHGTAAWSWNSTQHSPRRWPLARR
jgi:hypothetical protein